MASTKLLLHPPRYRGSTLLMAVVNSVQALMLPFIFVVAMFPLHTLRGQDTKPARAAGAHRV